MRRASLGNMLTTWGQDQGSKEYSKTVLTFSQESQIRGGINVQEHCHAKAPINAQPTILVSSFRLTLGNDAGSISTNGNHISLN
ncbi:hypothetical protein TNCV_331391 [Trichonephila clavipes]|nr:hypothetical protein TNCV_331391 [Trichonephila clavipes]